MSVRQGLLAILDQGECYGYQLRREFEVRTGGTWPVNPGQVYATVDRLERDGLVERFDQDADGHVLYRITASGHMATVEWLESPVQRATSVKNELAVKVAFAMTLPGVDVGRLIQSQRTATMSALQELTIAKRAGQTPTDLTGSLLIDSLIFETEAEIRWLDHAESRYIQDRRQGRSAAVPLSAEQPRRGRPVGSGAAGRVSGDARP